jgi:hypothetical protein
MMHACSRVGQWSVILAVALASATAAARPKAEKPEKIPVALGSWRGPSASAFKDALKHGLGKECKVVGAKSKGARALVDGTVEERGKGVVVRVVVKQPKTSEVVEQREFPFARPKPSRAQGDKMGKAVAAIARRVPADSPSPP